MSESYSERDPVKVFFDKELMPPATPTNKPQPEANIQDTTEVCKAATMRGYSEQGEEIYDEMDRDEEQIEPTRAVPASSNFTYALPPQRGRMEDAETRYLAPSRELRPKRTYVGRLAAVSALAGVVWAGGYLVARNEGLRLSQQESGGNVRPVAHRVIRGHSTDKSADTQQQKTPIVTRTVTVVVPKPKPHPPLARAVETTANQSVPAGTATTTSSTGRPSTATIPSSTPKTTVTKQPPKATTVRRTPTTETGGASLSTKAPEPQPGGGASLQTSAAPTKHNSRN